MTMKYPPLEMLAMEIDDHKAYSIVVCDLGNVITTECIQNRVYKLDTNKEIETSERGNPLGEYAIPDFYEGHNDIRERPTMSFTTPLHIYQSMEETVQKQVNSLKSLFNSYPTAFIWHNGQADENVSSTDCTYTQ